MALQLFSDHSDLNKARRALMITAVSLILIHDLEMTSNTMTIFGLEFVVSLEKISNYLALATAYFGYIFLFLAAGRGLQRLQERATKVLASLSTSSRKLTEDELSAMTADNAGSNESSESDTHMERLRKQTIGEIKFFGRWKLLHEAATFLAIEVAPVTAIAVYALGFHVGFTEASFVD